MPERRAQAEPAPPVVDVAIPCYQYGRFLRDCVESVLRQDYPHLRVVIIDNASTDDSVEVAEQLAREDARVEVIAHARNLGQHASFNEAIDWASSEYFLLLCADDLMLPGCLSHAVAILERHPEAGFVYGDALRLDLEGPLPDLGGVVERATWQVLPGGDIIERFCREGVNHIPGPSVVLARTEAQKRAGHYRPALPHTDDFEMWMRLASLGPAARTTAPLGVLRSHGLSRKMAAAAGHSAERPPALPWHDLAAFESFFAHEGRALPDADRLLSLARTNVSQRAYWAAAAHLCRGETAASVDLFRFAFRRRPINAIWPPLGYLFRRADSVGRVTEVIADMLSKIGLSRRAVPSDH